MTDDSGPKCSNRLSHRYEFRLKSYLSLVGAAVGLGNIWRFPAMAARSGGLPFVVAYLFCSILITYPLCCAEVIGGQLSQGSLIDFALLFGSFRYCVIAGGMICLLGTVSYYTTLVTWVAWYLIHSIHQPWFPDSEAIDHCERQTDLIMCPNITCGTGCTCIADLKHLKCTIDYLSYSKNFFDSMTIPNDTWASDGDVYIKAINWNLYFTYLVVVVAMFLCVIFGDRVFRTLIQWLIVPALMLFVGIAIYTVSLDGADTGLRYYLGGFSLQSMMDVTIWRNAITQSLYSVGIGNANISHLAALNDILEPIGYEAAFIVAVDTFVAFVSGCSVFSMLGAQSLILQISVEDLARQEGHGLIFITYSSGLSSWFRGSKWGALFRCAFWFMVFFLGFSSCTTFIHCLVHPIENMKLIHGGKSRHIICAVLFLYLLLIGFMNCSDFGELIVYGLDTYCAGVLTPVTIFVTVFLLSWVSCRRWYTARFGQKAYYLMLVSILVLCIIPGLFRAFAEDVNAQNVAFVMCFLVFPSLILLFIGMRFSRNQPSFRNLPSDSRVFSGAYYGVVTRMIELVTFEYQHVCNGCTHAGYIATVLRTVATPLVGILVFDMFLDRQFFTWTDVQTGETIPWWIQTWSFLFLGLYVLYFIIVLVLPGDQMGALASVTSEGTFNLAYKEEYAFGMIGGNYLPMNSCNCGNMDDCESGCKKIVVENRVK